MSAVLQIPPSQPGMKLLTAEEFFEQYENKRFELIDGRAVEVAMPGMKHGKVCFRAGQLLGNFCDEHQLGHVMSNDTFILIRRDPDSMLGADICFVSYTKMSKDQVVDGPITIPPELVFEVRSPSDLWTKAVGKMLDYIEAGVQVVVIFDPLTESASVFRSGHRQDIFEKDQALVLPDVLPGFAVPVAKFFE